MGRTKPVSVRFDPEKLTFLQLRENIESPQKIVDFLVDVYYWQNKLNPRTKNGPMTEYEALEGQVKEATEIPALELVKWAVIKSESLSQMDKRILMDIIAEKIQKLKTP